MENRKRKVGLPQKSWGNLEGKDSENHKGKVSDKRNGAVAIWRDFLTGWVWAASQVNYEESDGEEEAVVASKDEDEYTVDDESEVESNSGDNKRKGARVAAAAASTGGGRSQRAPVRSPTKAGAARSSRGRRGKARTSQEDEEEEEVGARSAFWADAVVTDRMEAAWGGLVVQPLASCLRRHPGIVRASNMHAQPEYGRGHEVRAGGQLSKGGAPSFFILSVSR